ncbi:MAG: branched-chain amino acid ABC transporter permease [Alphaproteobacteria bacterium]|nr:branched-chain amino acid ABC transporter permease [Alphaproteobacteria bacterium]
MNPRLVVLWTVGLLVALALPHAVASNAWLNFWINTLMFAALGIAWNVLGGYGGQSSFGHAVFFGTGAYGTAVLQIKLGVPALLAAPAAIGLGALVGLFIGGVSFRYGLRGSYFALVTLAFAEVFRILVSSFAFTGAGFGMLIPLDQRPINLQFPSRFAFYYAALALVGIGLAASAMIERSRFGAYLVAIRENEEAAKALGIDVFRIKLGAIVLSAALAAAVGVFYAQYLLFVDAGSAFGPAISVEALLGPIVGGAGTMLGPLLGAIALHGLGEAAKAAMGPQPGLNLILQGLLLILMLRFLPEGLIGAIRRWRGHA